MKRALLLTLFLTTPLFAVDRNECQSALTHLGTLHQLRAKMLKAHISEYDVQRFTDQRMEELRRGWMIWVRPSDGTGPVAKKEFSVQAEQGSSTDRVEQSASKVYEVLVSVPRKRSLIRENNPVYVGAVEISYDGGGRTRTRMEAVNAWMNPGTSRTFDLGTIAERAHATIEAATAQRHIKQALVEIHLRQAVSQDDPANPAYSTVRMLQRVRENPDPATVDAEIAALETSLFPGTSSVPILTIVDDFRRADQLMRSEKAEEQEKGAQLLKETLRRLR